MRRTVHPHVLVPTYSNPAFSAQFSMRVDARPARIDEERRERRNAGGFGSAVFALVSYNVPIRILSQAIYIARSLARELAYPWKRSTPGCESTQMPAGQAGVSSVLALTYVGRSLYKSSWD
jgi:hypothetical protein